MCVLASQAVESRQAASSVGRLCLARPARGISRGTRPVRAPSGPRSVGPPLGLRKGRKAESSPLVACRSLALAPVGDAR